MVNDILFENRLIYFKNDIKTLDEFFKFVEQIKNIPLERLYIQYHNDLSNELKIHEPVLRGLELYKKIANRAKIIFYYWPDYNLLGAMPTFTNRVFNDKFDWDYYFTLNPEYLPEISDYELIPYEIYEQLPSDLSECKDKFMSMLMDNYDKSKEIVVHLYNNSDYTWGELYSLGNKIKP